MQGQHSDGSRSVNVEFDSGLAVLTIDRPHARNAISLDTMDQLNAALDTVVEARVLVIKGAGDRAFVSGGDLKELAAITTHDEAAEMAWRMRGICDRLVNFSGPVIAALNGHALGGGAEFATAADIRLAADDIKIGFNQVTLQIMPAWGGAERLAALVGPGRALMLAGTGEVLSAAEAERIGLVDKVFERSRFDDGWLQVAHALTAAPVRDIKRVVRGLSPTDAVDAFARHWISDEHWEAVDNRTKPVQSLDAGRPA
ncbi:enoyl-CoA hydratase/isomerase family protein [Mycolicibacterium aubagnense]|uniref:Enoyl-CoA hydratase n=1 Tax=Mycolicibacterium aubagnense TaxID=319707 RepID=A0ABM7I9Q4_9MYCO|nr:enoyl-CoA hydratase/isomerase family protein [Mycolicibacterium aubagnense]TLH60200.1 enoyl-CoA hydratase [Mycolicibacterium aubagnense]WGI34728.1 enoyl-CoA hydratase/isomerase family protein [Mycolicibacterium aubagnense]BBX83382.1 enoyl-CoA hydratase [Mycolicibacterium aubagnense]